MGKVFGILYDVYRDVVDKYYNKGIKVSCFVDDVYGTFSYADDVFVHLRRGKSVSGKARFESEEFGDRREEEISLTPLYRGDEVVAFELTYNYASSSYDPFQRGSVLFAEVTKWIISKEPFKIKIRHYKPYHRDYYEEPMILLDDHEERIPDVWEEEVEVIVDVELFNKCAEAYRKAMEVRRKAAGPRRRARRG